MTDRRQFLKRDASIASEETLLLLIHGLAGSNKGTWGELPTILRKAEDLGQEVTIDFFSYPSMLFRLPFMKRGPKIQELARGLRTQIENRFGSFKRIILICHSLGGLVARQYLLDESRANHRTRIVGLVLFAVPNNGDDLAKLVALFPFGNHQIRQLRPDSDFIENLNEDWAARRLQESVHVIYVIGAQDKVVKKLSAQAFWGNTNTETIVDKGHKDIVKPQNAEDMTVKILRNFLPKCLGPAKRDQQKADAGLEIWPINGTGMNVITKVQDNDSPGAEFFMRLRLQLLPQSDRVDLVQFSAFYWANGRPCHNGSASLTIGHNEVPLLPDSKTLVEPIRLPPSGTSLSYSRSLRPPLMDETPRDCDYGDLTVTIVYRDLADTHLLSNKELLFRFQPGGELEAISHVRQVTKLTGEN